MVRKIGRDILHRFEGNPIITVMDMPFRCNTVFNGTPMKIGNDYLLLIRVEGLQGYSYFSLAKSKNGLHWNVQAEPVMWPMKEEPFAKYERRGIEDPRATYIDGTYYIMYTAASKYGPRIALAQTDNFQHFERVAMISEPGNKDGVLFPEKIKGRYARLDRPIGRGVGSIWISYSEDLHSWGDSKFVMAPRPGYWDSYRIGASVPPIRTDKGWLEIYHGMKMTTSGPIYKAGTALLDFEDPSTVIARSCIALLSPREDYERIGDVGNVVFACGAIVEPNNEVKLYYGAADTYLCVATASLDEIIENTLSGENENGVGV